MFSKFQFLDAVKNPLQKIKASIKQAITKQKIELIEIISNKLFYISPPTSQNIDSLLEELKKIGQFQIWNFGEYSYNEDILTKLLDGRQRNSDGKQIVYNLTYEYFANIPFCETIKSIENIEAFLSLNNKNRVYIHCQDNKRRSAVFLASYIFLTGQQTDIVTSILKVNQMLKISIEDKQISQGSTASGTIYKSQHLVLKNLMNYMNNSVFINKNGWNLKKILINNAPKIHLVLKLQNFPKDKEQAIKFKVLLEIRSAEGIMYKKIFQDEFIEGESLCLRIPETQPVVLKDDFLIIVKYVYEKKGYSILRAQLNTNFIYDPYFRVQRNDMDLSVNNAHPQNQTVFMDLLLESNPKELSELSQLNILKENSENDRIVETEKKELRKQSLEMEKKDEKNSKEQEQQEDGFGILDEEQQAEHNQKMQREIQEQLAKELENMRKKRNQQGKKSEEAPTSYDDTTYKKQVSRKTNTKTEKSESESEKQKTNTQEEKENENEKLQSQANDQTKIEISSETNEKVAKKESKQDQKPEHKEIANDDQESEQGSQQESSSSQQQSSSEQAQQQEEDLDDYLTKLQSQAQKHE